MNIAAQLALILVAVVVLGVLAALCFPAATRDRPDEDVDEDGQDK